jgi:hypothetical protein
VYKVSCVGEKKIREMEATLRRMDDSRNESPFTAMNGNGDGREHDDVGVSADDWDRAVQSQYPSQPSRVAMDGEEELSDDGGVKLRVEQVRLVLFEGKRPPEESSMSGSSCPVSLSISFSSLGDKLFAPMAYRSIPTLEH